MILSGNLPFMRSCVDISWWQSSQIRSAVSLDNVLGKKAQKCLMVIGLRRSTGWVFSLVPPRKVLSMELVPPNREKLLSSPRMAKIPTKKVKVHVKVCQTFTFCCDRARKIKVWPALTWTFTFLQGFLPTFVNLVIFLYWAGPVPYLEFFWAGPVKKLTLYVRISAGHL